MYTCTYNSRFSDPPPTDKWLTIKVSQGKWILGVGLLIYSVAWAMAWTLAPLTKILCTAQWSGYNLRHDNIVTRPIFQCSYNICNIQVIIIYGPWIILQLTTYVTPCIWELPLIKAYKIMQDLVGDFTLHLSRICR